MTFVQRLLATAGEDENQGPLADTDYWAKRGAGCMLMAQSTLRFLLPMRSAQVSEPHTYGTWGGAIDGSENPAVSVRRELREESGYVGVSSLYPLLVYRDFDQGRVYHNFLAVIPEEFEPVLNWETEHAIWVPFDEFPRPQHPGLESLLKDPYSIRTINSHMERAYHV